MPAWTDEEKDIVRDCWQRGLAATVTATELALAGYEKRTRNAVIGCAHRLGLTVTHRLAAPRPKAPPPPKKPRCVVVPVAAPVLCPVPVVPKVRDLRRPGITMLDLDTAMNRCRYPMWADDARPPTSAASYCGDPVRADRPYCPYHCGIAYAPPAERVRAA